MLAPQYNVPSADPRARLRELLADQEITPEIAALRLAILREDVPEALVQIDSLRADDTAIAVKVIIGLPGGARNSAIATADVDPERSWSAQHDLVQAIGIARTLDGLGVTTDGLQADSVTPSAQKTPTAVAPTDDDHLPEYSWTSFWQAAHARSISREQVEQALGRSIQQATPKDALNALQSAGLWS